MGADIKYRVLPQEEKHRIAEIVGAFAQETGLTETEGDTFKTVVLSGIMRVLVAETEEGRIIGIIGYQCLGTLATASLLYVLPEYRNWVIGGSLLKAGIADGQMMGCTKHRIIATEANRILYEKLGFKCVLYVLELETG